jgi:hypothetical protein
MIKILEQIDNEVKRSQYRHKKLFGSQVDKFVSTFQNKYENETRLILNHLSKIDKLNIGYNVLYDILIKNRWAGWELCNLAPVLNVYPVEEYPIAVIAYNALHLTDDGIDGHTNYEHINQTSYYGYLLNNNFNQREASALSAMMGMDLLNTCIKRLNEKGLRNSADIILRLSNNVFTGMLGESLYTKPLTEELYYKIIKRKSVAYQMILDHIFLRTIDVSLRSKLLVINSFIVKMGQLTDDLMDQSDDTKHQNFSIMYVEGISKEKIINNIIKLIQTVWDLCLQLEDKLKDAFAVRMADWVRLVKEELN